MSGIILDTNVVSEPKRASPDPKVRAWFEIQDVERLYPRRPSSVSWPWALNACLQADFRRWLDALITGVFSGRILTFDVEAALIYGKIVADALARGRPPTVGDAQIAAVARRDRMAVASRDVREFATLDVPIIDPWHVG